MWNTVQIRWRPADVPLPSDQMAGGAGGQPGDDPTSLDGREPEWLATNGIGGFASGTVPGIHRRRYHGLLIASLRPPVRRRLLWAKTDEWLVFDGVRTPLGANDYGDVVHPGGWRRVDSFAVYPFPTTTWLARGVRLERTVFMVRGQNTTVLLYTVHGCPPGLELHLEPFVNFRDYHHTVRSSPAAPDKLDSTDFGFVVSLWPEAPELLLGAGCGERSRRLDWEPDPVWHRNFHYAIEGQRGLDCVEDHLRPGLFRWRPRGTGDRLALVGHCPVPEGSAPPPWQGGGDALLHWALEQHEAAVARRRRTAERALAAGDRVKARLLLAADDFIVRRQTTGAATILAGYPWFTDWGRDAMISLPGLLLATGRFDTAKEVLLTFAAHRADGLIPNRFPDDGGEPLYNSVDASLWFVWAAWHYAQAAGDGDTLRGELLPVMEDVLKSFIRGTRHGISMGGDGLVHASDPGLQLTWMDAKAGDWVVTPRAGAPVEVNALWYNALRTVATLKRRHHDSSAAPFESLARKVRRSFLRNFLRRRGGLYDVVSEGTPAAEVRPNQIFAASLPFVPLPRPLAGRVVAVVGEQLLTPVGLRTLAPRDPAYIGRYGGDQRRRDAAYHQGTVWPWLLGAFADGRRRTGGPPPGTASLFRALEAHMEKEAALGHVSEIFAGDPPHPARGCFAQAWSVAEWLRVYDGPAGPAEA